MKSTEILEKLKLAAAHQLIVRVEREEIEDGWFDGYVARMGDQFFALAVIDEYVHVNGFACLRYEDVTNLTLPTPNEHFLVKALSMRGEYPPVCPSIDLTSALPLVQTANDKTQLITVHAEIAEPETCWVGRLRSYSEERIVLDLVTPAAEWDVDPYTIETDHVTRVDFGGEYENALMLVAGERPRKLGA